MQLTELELENIRQNEKPYPSELAWDIDSNKFLKRTLRNCVNCFIIQDLELFDMLAYNEFTHEIIFLRRAPWHRPEEAVKAWSDQDSVKCKYYLTMNKRYDMPVTLINEAIVVVSSYKPYHPIKAYLKSLEWDGKPRLDMWLTDYLGAVPSVYTKAVGRKILLACVARILNPGCKFDHMLVLEGKQGIGKSMACAVLGGPWFSEIHIAPDSKDTIMDIRGKWICEVPEMICSTRSSVEALKAFISRTTDRIRAPYTKMSVDLPRQNIFIGTINPGVDLTYLQDRTGNRRFWPVLCDKIKVDALAKVKDQLFAEAYECVKVKKEDLHLSAMVEKLAEEQQKARTVTDPWFDAVAEYVANKDHITTQEIWAEKFREPIAKLNRSSMLRIAAILKELNFGIGRTWDYKSRHSGRAFVRLGKVKKDEPDQ